MTAAELEEAAREWVARTTEEQGLPIVVDDPGTIERIARLLEAPTRDEDPDRPPEPSSNTHSSATSHDDRTAEV